METELWINNSFAGFVDFFELDCKINENFSENNLKVRVVMEDNFKTILLDHADYTLVTMDDDIILYDLVINRVVTDESLLFEGTFQSIDF